MSPYDEQTPGQRAITREIEQEIGAMLIVLDSSIDNNNGNVSYWANGFMDRIKHLKNERDLLGKAAMNRAEYGRTFL